VGEDFIAARSAGRDDEPRRSRCGRVDDRSSPGGGAIGRQAIVVGVVHDGDTLFAEMVEQERAQLVGKWTDKNRVQIVIVEVFAQRAGKTQCFARRQGRSLRIGLHEYKDHFAATPILKNMSTTALAASGPLPRTSTELGCCGGDLSLTR